MLLPSGSLEPEVCRATVIGFVLWRTHMQPCLNIGIIRFEYSTKQLSNGPCPGYSDLLSIDTPKQLHVNHGNTSGTEIA
jgi:hypothetical protein